MSRCYLRSLLCSLGAACVLSQQVTQHNCGLPLPSLEFDLGHHEQRTDERRFLQTSGLPELAPLYPGYGTHFAYVFVGTPFQRQSVIIDTGSHYTAFPCTGCQQCGKHTDNYFNPALSKTAEIQKCGAGNCEFSQSYAEGSSWKAYKIKDQLFVGGFDNTTVPLAAAASVNFLFGCQTFETGLFRTQLADGIMGMSMSPETLPQQLQKSGLVDNKLFALCFRIGGGIMTLGGVNTKIHKTDVIHYAKMYPSSGWYGVKVTDIQFQSQQSEAAIDIGFGTTMNMMSSGKGTIVDSGTTDTYLPAALAAAFKNKFKALTGIAYTNTDMVIKPEDLSKLPNLIFTLQDAKDDGTTFTVVMPWSSYTESSAGGKYVFRIYLTESSGAVLGANFMNGHNIIFDTDGKKVGFSPSNCKYEEYGEKETKPPTASPTRPKHPSPDSPSDKCITVGQLFPIDECSAFCRGDNITAPYVVEGVQRWSDKCIPPGPIDFRPCHIQCSKDNRIMSAPESILCPVLPWTECSKNCRQTKVVTHPVKNGGACSPQHTMSTRPCNSGSCPVGPGDYLIFIDLKVVLPMSKWSYAISENFFDAAGALFKVPPGNVEVLADNGAEFTFLGAKIQLQIRLKVSEFKSILELTQTGESIVAMVNDFSFAEKFVSALNKSSTENDGLDYSRYGWMSRRHIQVLSVIGFPVGGDRPQIDDTGPILEDSSSTKLQLIIVGVAIGAVIISVIIGFLYCRLKQEFAALSKDKGGSLTEMWKRFRADRKARASYKQVHTTEMVDFGDSFENDTSLDAGDLESIRS